jgi:hypothetical protein
MFFYRWFKTFYSVGWWHGRYGYPTDHTYVMVPIYPRPETKQPKVSILAKDTAMDSHDAVVKPEVTP